MWERGKRGRRRRRILLWSGWIMIKIKRIIVSISISSTIVTIVVVVAVLIPSLEPDRSR